MQPKRSITAPLYIPEEFTAAHGAAARLQVARSMPPGRAPRPREWRRREVRLMRLAAVAVVGTWAVLVAVWTLLALQTGSRVWTAVAVVGAAVLMLAAVALPRLRMLQMPLRSRWNRV